MKKPGFSKLPLGFLASGISAGLKRSGKKDLGLVFCPDGARGVVFFTASSAKAAPLILSRRYLRKNKGKIKAVIVNSGNANCFTKEAGILDAKDICRSLASYIKAKEEEVLPASTGIIGKRLPLAKIKKNIPSLLANLKDSPFDFSQAILTTDTKPKISQRQVKVKGKTVKITGIAKGSGMIYPRLLPHATMLAFILTDCCIKKSDLAKAAKLSIDNSFNSISVDGCMSTNDTVFFLASQKGQSISSKDKKAFSGFSKAIEQVCLDLAKMIVKDGEGATKLVEIEVVGAKDNLEAKKGAFSIANSNLFKTAIYGQNPNWGRIVAALGQAGIRVDNLKVEHSSLRRKEVKIKVILSRGRGKAKVYTSDLSPEYIRINAAYS